jgi:hypothetical protein
MFYPSDEWIPLIEIPDHIDKHWAKLTCIEAVVFDENPINQEGERTRERTAASQPREQSPERERERERERELTSLTWQVCDTCQAATFTKRGTIVLLSRSLFKRRSNAGVYGHFVKLDLGQIGSGGWVPPSAEQNTHDIADQCTEEELETLLHPFYKYHILIRRSDFVTFLDGRKAAQKVEVAQSRKPGRPQKIYDFWEYFQKMYPDGRMGVPIREVIRKVHEAGGPNISQSGFHSALNLYGDTQTKSPG